ncbi:MAG: DUF86 domain-containing protein [Bacteroidetes bacterium]|nr:DUF86 domain-containing protein [Bacteroidota bacterium]
MKKDNSIYLGHILECTVQIEEYMKDITREKFLDQRMIQDAVIRQIEIIGEATKNISVEFRELHQDIPWKRMAGMRDVIIHEYFQVNIEVVFETANSWIPELRSKIKTLLGTT